MSINIIDLDDLRRRSDTLHPDDCERLRAIELLVVAGDVPRLARAIRTYYGDLDRANRTPRDFLYLHVGILVGALENFS